MTIPDPTSDVFLGPQMRTVRSLAIRHADNALDAFVAHIVDLLDQDGALVDISQCDRRGTTIQLRIRQIGGQT